MNVKKKLWLVVTASILIILSGNITLILQEDKFSIVLNDGSVKVKYTKGELSVYNGRFLAFSDEIKIYYWNGEGYTSMYKARDTKYSNLSYFQENDYTLVKQTIYYSKGNLTRYFNITEYDIKESFSWQPIEKELRVYFNWIYSGMDSIEEKIVYVDSINKNSVAEMDFGIINNWKNDIDNIVRVERFKNGNLNIRTRVYQGLASFDPEIKLDNKPELINKEIFNGFEEQEIDNVIINVSTYYTKQVWQYEDEEVFIELDENAHCVWSNPNEDRKCSFSAYVEYKDDKNDKIFSKAQLQPDFHLGREKNIKTKWNKKELKDIEVMEKGNHNFTIEFDYPANNNEKINITLFGVLFDPTVSACTTITGNNSVYTMNQNITNATSQCITFADQVHNNVFDCAGFTISSNNVNDYAIYADYGVEKNDANITIKNCILTDWDSYAINMDSLGTVTINNLTFISSDSSIRLADSEGSIISNNSISFNYMYGYGLYLYSSSVGLVYNNIFKGGYEARLLYSSVSPNWKFYNNLFNLTIDSLDYFNLRSIIFFNTSNQTGDRIYGAGTNIGGNYYINTNANGGYSANCTDANKDGFCDINRTEDNVVDYLPLSDEYEKSNIIYSDNSTNSTLAGKSIEHRLKWQATDELSGYVFAIDNGTGTLINDSWVAFSGVLNWSNVTKTVNDTIGATIQWCVYANDTNGVWNSTSCDNPFSYVTTEQGEGNTCDCPDGEDWGWDFADNCNITEDCDITPFKFFILNVNIGTWSVNASITANQTSNLNGTAGQILKGNGSGFIRLV